MITIPRLRYFVVDAFTNQPFAGNPAAVVPLEEWKDDQWLQNVAMEMNLAETAYLVPNATGYDLRWFTPKVEASRYGCEFDCGSSARFASSRATYPIVRAPLGTATL